MPQESLLQQTLGEASSGLGIAQLAGQTVEELAGGLLTSIEGDEVGTLGGAGTGGAVFGGILAVSMSVNPVIGAVVGATLGLIQGELENQSRRDEVFQSVTKEYYKTVQAESTATLSSGIALAAQREQAASTAADPQGGTFHQLTATVTALEQEKRDLAMGEGYVAVRQEGLREQAAYLQGDKGQSLQEANRIIGEWEAKLDNEREASLRQAEEAMMETQDYQDALKAGDGAALKRLLQLAQVQGENSFRANSGGVYQQEFKSQERLAQEIVEDTASRQESWQSQYSLEQVFTKGTLAFALNQQEPPDPQTVQRNVSAMLPGNELVPGAILALPARQEGGAYPELMASGGSEAPQTPADEQKFQYTFQIGGNNFTVREEADVEKVARSLLDQMIRVRAIS